MLTLPSIVLLLGGAWRVLCELRSPPLFTSLTEHALPAGSSHNPLQVNYGMAVTDVDGDGSLEIIVAGYNEPNLVLKYDASSQRLVNLAQDDLDSPYYALRDEHGSSIGVAACDIDGDGWEEIYFLNTNNAFSGTATYADKLFKHRNGRWEDILNDEVNVQRGVTSWFAGRSVACIDRKGLGRYSIYVANYASGSVGPHALIEMDVLASDVIHGVVALSNVAKEAGVDKYTGGRGVTTGPIVNHNMSDIFCDNEYGPNFLFRNNGDGTFTDIAVDTGIADATEHGRGVALADFNRDGKTDIVYANWNGPHRLFLQTGEPGRIRFQDAATPEFALPSSARTLIATDFDNDQHLEVFFNNMANKGHSSNRAFSIRHDNDGQLHVMKLNLGDADEPAGTGTGGVVTDLNGDGTLELLLSHGESKVQPLTVYTSAQGKGNNWLRVIPRTEAGAFARGARVQLHMERSSPQLRIIDGGSGYLCQMEPVAHFGLAHDVGTRVEVTWPDGLTYSRRLSPADVNSVIEIPYPAKRSQHRTRLQVKWDLLLSYAEHGCG
uniref:Cartilage acidic protein 1 n=1 Tax=Eptatretus burgeri TaxID=7764 RepID=A0A8C4RCI1_EPTBU